MERFPNKLKKFIDEVSWTFAKTMPEWPHEYIVRKNVSDELFIKIAEHIQINGYPGRFYEQKYIFFEEDGLMYWTMGNPIAETTIINRTKVENSYENRLKYSSLPKNRRE